MRILIFLTLMLCACHSAEPKTLVSAKLQDSKERGAFLARVGIDLARAGQFERAEEYLTAALDSGASADEVLPHLIRVAVRLKHLETAVQYGDAFLPKLKDQELTRVVLGGVYLVLGRADRAEAHLKKAVQGKAANAEAHYLLAEVYGEHQNEPVLADQHYREYLRLAPDGAFSESARSHLLSSTSAPAPQQDMPLRLPSHLPTSFAE